MKLSPNPYKKMFLKPLLMKEEHLDQRGEAGSKRDLEEKEISNPAAGAPPKKVAKKSSKSSASSTLLDKIVEAIRNEKKPGGSSRVSIKKYLVTLITRLPTRKL